MSLIFKQSISDKINEEKRILKKYLKIFKQKDSPMTQTCMCWGLEVGYGWMWLIDALCGRIQMLINSCGLPQLEATQVKEKYGSLRFYYSWEDSSKCKLSIEERNKYMDEIENVISFAEDLSNYICEECGSTRNVSQTKGWIVTLCNVCMKKRGKK